VSRTVVRGGLVYEGTESLPAEADVVIEAGRIVDVGIGLDGDEAIDASGMAVLPGLFDCHVHVCSSGPDMMVTLERPFSYQFYVAEQNLAATLDCGITTVRDASGADLGVQQAVESGLVVGPRMQISVSALSQTGGHGDGWMPSGVCVPHGISHPGRPPAIVDGPDEMRQKVRELIRAGADVIKVFTSGGVLSPRDDPRHAHFRDDELDVLVTEATAAGRFVMAHAQATDGIKSAVRAGIRSIEHGIYLDDEAIEMMLERGTWLVPTLSAPRAVVNAAAAGARIPESSVRKAEEVIAAHDDSFKRAVAAGVKIAMGTDSGVGPHGTNLVELDLMVRGGMEPIGALRATTSSAAELLGLDEELGTLAPGKRADLVLLAGDPLDVTDLKARVTGVFKDGLRVR
jgi:imidazolonepropionase-like amidohydrolase